MSGFNYSGGSVADPGHESFDFDNIANRALDHCRKWDAGIVRGKYPDTPDDFIPMWIADMDFAAAPCIRAVLRELSENGAYGYTYPYREFVDSIVGWQARRHGAEVRSEWVKNTYGTVPTIHYLYQAFCQPNDKVILNTPVYDPFGYAAHNNGIRVVCNPLAYDGGEYSIDFDLLERQLDTERPRVMLFCSPHNPGGRTWTLTEIEQVAELCERYGVLFVVDEVHGDIMLSGVHISALSLPGRLLDNLIVLSSPNKGFNLGGLKTSYAIVPNRRIRDILLHRLEMNSITSPNVFGAAAVTAAYERGEAWLDALTDYLREGYRMCEEAVARMTGWRLMPMSASYLPWVDVSATGHTATEVCEHMAHEAGVVLGDGTFYVEGGSSFVRLNLGTSHEILARSFERLSRHQLVG